MNQESANLPHFHTSPSAGEGASTELSQAEETLRQLARLEPPVGIADRVHYRLEQAQNEPQNEHQYQSFWALWMPIRRMQYAGAAILTIAVGASSWGVYHAHHLPKSQPANPLVQSAPSSSFGAAGAERHPGTLAPIKVPPVHKRKPSPSRVKPVPKATQLSSDAGTSRSNTGSTSDANVPEPKR